MAEKTTVEIVANPAEDFLDADQGAELGSKVEGLEREKLELQRENKETKEKFQELTAEIEKLKSNEKETKERLREMELVIEQTEEGKDVLESVANRAMELETEVARLQHDLISAMAEGERERIGDEREQGGERDKRWTESCSAVFMVLREKRWTESLSHGFEREAEMRGSREERET